MFRVSVRPPLPTPTMWRGFWAGPRVLVERDREAVLAGSELGVLVGTISKSLTNWPMSLRILVVGVVAVHEVGTTPGAEVARIVTRRTGALTGSSTLGWAHTDAKACLSLLADGSGEGRPLHGVYAVAGAECHEELLVRRPLEGGEVLRLFAEHSFQAGGVEQAYGADFLAGKVGEHVRHSAGHEHERLGPCLKPLVPDLDGQYTCYDVDSLVLVRVDMPPRASGTGGETAVT